MLHDLVLMSWFVVALVALCAVGAVVGVLAVRRAMRRIDPAADRGEERGLVRLRAQVATGLEQTLVALVRELQVPRTADGAGYGELYMECGAADGVVVRTVSPLDRGLIAPLTMRRGTGCTELEYAIVQLPQDETLQAVALDFEARLIAALRRIDRRSEVRLAGTALRDLADGVWRGAPLPQRVPAHR